MILALDIGNTHISMGCFADDGLKIAAKLSARPSMTGDEYACKILDVLRLYSVDPGEIHGAILSSVVPSLTEAIKSAVQAACSVTPLVVGPGIKTGLGIRCDNPVSVGADLICACVAVSRLYGSPALIVDMGTATKMMVLDDHGAFIGVSIIPGVSMGLTALSEGTAQLPQVSLETPTAVIGKNTADCMRSGVIYGNASMVDGMICRINQEYGKALPVIATGGAASAILPHCTSSYTLDEHLVLKGLYFLYQKNK